MVGSWGVLKDGWDGYEWFVPEEGSEICVQLYAGMQTPKNGASFPVLPFFPIKNTGSLASKQGQQRLNEVLTLICEEREILGKY